MTARWSQVTQLKIVAGYSVSFHLRRAYFVLFLFPFPLRYFIPKANQVRPKLRLVRRISRRRKEIGRCSSRNIARSRGISSFRKLERSKNRETDFRYFRFSRITEKYATYVRFAARRPVSVYESECESNVFNTERIIEIDFFQ